MLRATKNTKSSDSGCYVLLTSLLLSFEGVYIIAVTETPKFSFFEVKISKSALVLKIEEKQVLKAHNPKQKLRGRDIPFFCHN